MDNTKLIELIHQGTQSGNDSKKIGRYSDFSRHMYRGKDLLSKGSHNYHVD